MSSIDFYQMSNDYFIVFAICQVDKMEFKNLTVGNMKVGSMKVGNMKVGNMKVGKMKVGNLKVGMKRSKATFG
jgi:hypothetical protein